jgi:HK97 family phage major capsid protein
MVIGLQTKALEEEKAELLARVRAITDMATEEKRETTEDENKEIDSLLAQADEYKPKIERARKVDAAMLSTKQPAPAAPGRQIGPQAGEPEDDASKRIVIPAMARRRSNLVAFRGENRMEDAYTAGKFLAARLWKDEKSDQWCRDRGIQNAMSTNINTAGGDLVFPEFEATVIQLVEEYGVARRTAQIVPMGSDTKTVPTRTGGLTAYAVNENATITASDMTWNAVELVARKWATLSKYSSELDEDSIISMADALTVEIARAFAQKEDDALFKGDGTATYHGIVGLISALAAGCKAEAVAGNVAFDSLDLVDFEKAVGLLPMYPGIKPAWFISKPGFYASMSRLMTSAGGNTIGDVGGGANGMQFLGYPVVFNLSTVQSLATQTDQTKICYFGDMAMSAMLGDRRGMTVAIDESLYFASDALAIRGTMRYDINVHSRGDASNPGAMVYIATNDS